MTAILAIESKSRFIFNIFERTLRLLVIITTQASFLKGNDGQVLLKKEGSDFMRYLQVWKRLWVQQQMELRGDTIGSNTNSQHGIRVQRTKNKGVPKQSRHSNTGELKLNKFGSQSKLDKRTSGRDYDKDEEIQRVFRLHARNQINEDQTLFSLKLLGYVCQTAEDYAKFNKIWNKYGSEFLNEESFRLLAEEVRTKGEMKDNRLIFDVLTQGASVLDKSRLLAMGKELGMNIQGLIEFCGRDGVIDFSQFDSILKFTNALK